MRQLPRRLLSFALAPLILSNAAVASQCTMVLEMRCVWCTTYGRVLGHSQFDAASRGFSTSASPIVTAYG